MTAEATSPPPPQVRLCLGVTGHRAHHPVFAGHRDHIEAVLRELFDLVDGEIASKPPVLGPGTLAPTRLHSLLADGVDQMASQLALARGWEVVSPLPFGDRLNAAINAAPVTAADGRALLGGGDAADAATQARAQRIRALAAQAHLFELADRDEEIAAHWLARLDAPEDLAKAQRFAAESSERVALAGRVLIEQSDILIAVWDGTTSAHVGGTGATIVAALDFGAPVIWIDLKAPQAWRILRTPESLAAAGPPPSAEERAALVRGLVGAVMEPAGARPGPHGRRSGSGAHSMHRERWHARSNALWHAYRRVEAAFGGEKGRSPFRSLSVSYESPDQVGAESAADIMAQARSLPGADPELADKIERHVLRRFAWADGVSSHLSDAYRGGMTLNFLFSGLAVVTGVAYLPFAHPGDKAWFAAGEFSFLIAILAITAIGQRRRWHGRWFETRRVAEYFRHSPLMLILGVARPPGRWPRGTETSWPEWYARQGLREVGLPRVAVSRAYLRAGLQSLLDSHVERQRDYHYAKARRLTSVHHNLDRASGLLFVLAVIAVATFLVLTAVAQVVAPAARAPPRATEIFTFLGVLLPTFGAAIAGIRYFGDFERFAAISEVTAEKLDAVHARITLLLSGGQTALDYGLVSDLAHAADDIVVSEIENWQAVFGGKHVTVPV